MLHIGPDAHCASGSELSGAHTDCTNTQETSGGPRWRTSWRDRRGMTSMRSAGSPNHLRNWKVLLWVVVCLLPLVDGARVGGDFGADLGQVLGIEGGMGQKHFPDTLPEVDEEQEEESDSDTSWYGLYDPSVIEEAGDYHSGSLGRRSPRNSDPSDADPKGSAKKKKKRKKKEKDKERDRKGKRKGNSRKTQQSSRDCRVEKREMRVRDLGLGFDSDEIVLFKFCVGSCQSTRTNYDLALRALMLNGSLPRRTLRRVSAHPCCRPDRYEPVSFMDAHTTWQTIKSLSAASCMCMG
ncbi:hypothetical protein DPEC_G00057270 [Dallia pectoralis]|uniref:Uncharacterized protein n=1 Tax=Dallia pectoralis TaxID=75939 RepID=A0ACC2H5U8_DALPE|nr:hypothetical protein DPEC_G00057270 [Dallia pectoralis]